MSDSEKLNLADQVFETFSWRIEPQEIWSTDHYEYDYYNNGFKPVPPREFDLTVFGAHPFHTQGDRLCVMSVEGYLYYLPSFIALLLENFDNYDDRIGDLGDALIGTLRSFSPSIGPIAEWVSDVREPNLSKEYYQLDVDRLGRQMEQWFVSKISPNQCENIADMTEAERIIVAQFLDQLVLHPDFVDDENQIQSVQSILRNETSYSKRLGAKSESDIGDLLELLNVTARQFPTRFPPDIVASIAQKLRSQMG